MQCSVVRAVRENGTVPGKGTALSVEAQGICVSLEARWKSLEVCFGERTGFV